MTKENSTKPAFVSEETGRGDGFLAATHVWESFALPPRAAELLLPPPPPPPPPSTNQTLQPGGQTTAHMEITSANDGQQDYRNKPPTEMTHLVLIDIVFHLLNCGLIRSLTFLTEPTEPIIRVWILCISFIWLTPAYVCSPGSDLALCHPLTRGHDDEARLWFVFGHHSVPREQ